MGGDPGEDGSVRSVGQGGTRGRIQDLKGGNLGAAWMLPLCTATTTGSDWKGSGFCSAPSGRCSPFVGSRHPVSLGVHGLTGQPKNSAALITGDVPGLSPLTPTVYDMMAPPYRAWPL